MKLLLLCLCLLAILLQAISASSFDGGSATLKSKKAHRRKVKKVTDDPVKKKATVKRPSKEGAGKRKDIVAKEDKSRSLSEILPEVLVEIVISYFKDGAYYSILVSTHTWLLKQEPQIAVDNARLYVIVKAKGIKGLDHSSANLKEEERHYIEFGNPQWSNYDDFASSYDGRYVSFSHKYKASTDHERQIKLTTKWLIQGKELEDGRLKHVAFGGEGSFWKLLSRDGQTLFSYSVATKVTGVYQIMGEAGENSLASLKFELEGSPCAVSGKGNRVMMEKGDLLTIHSIDKDASKLVCQINGSGSLYALNEDGSEAVIFHDGHYELRIVDVNKAARGKVEPVVVKGLWSLRNICRLAYSDENKLLGLDIGNKVSLFDPSTKEFTVIEAPQTGQDIAGSVISPGAEYFATIERVRKKEKGGKTSCYRTTVKRRLENAALSRLFGRETGKVTSIRKQTRVHQRSGNREA